MNFNKTWTVTVTVYYDTVPRIQSYYTKTTQQDNKSEITVYSSFISLIRQLIVFIVTAVASIKKNSQFLEFLDIYSSYLGAVLALNPDGEKNCNTKRNL